MKRLKDYDEFSQGIPRSKKMVDMGTGRVHVVGGSYVKLEDFLAMQQTLQDKINEQIGLMELILKTLRILAIRVTDVDPNDEEDD